MFEQGLDMGQAVRDEALAGSQASQLPEGLQGLHQGPAPGRYLRGSFHPTFLASSHLWIWPWHWL